MSQRDDHDIPCDDCDHDSDELDEIDKDDDDDQTTAIIIGVIVAIAVVAILVGLGVFIYYKRKTKKTTKENSRNAAAEASAATNAATNATYMYDPGASAEKTAMALEGFANPGSTLPAATAPPGSQYTYGAWGGGGGSGDVEMGAMGPPVYTKEESPPSYEKSMADARC